MEKAKVFLFTSPGCPHCPPAKIFIEKFKNTRDDFEYMELSLGSPNGVAQAQKLGVTSTPTFIVQGPGYDGNIISLFKDFGISYFNGIA